MDNENTKKVVKQKIDPETCQNSYFAYLEEIAQYKLLSVDEEVSLFQRIQEGDDVAKDLFIKSNLRLVIKEAKKYYVSGYNDLLDLIQDGNIGLIKAVEQFDISRGCKFSTYAVYLINKAIQRSPSRSGLPLEIPQNKITLISKIRKAVDAFEENNGYKPSLIELAKLCNTHVDKIVELMPFISSSLSLYSKIKTDEDSREIVDVFDAYYHDEPSDVEKAFIVEETREEFRSILKKVLNAKEIYILYSRWGLANTPIKAVADLAEELNMSKQGVRQCEGRAKEKLKRHLLMLNKSFLDFT